MFPKGFRYVALARIGCGDWLYGERGNGEAADGARPRAGQGTDADGTGSLRAGANRWQAGVYADIDADTSHEVARGCMRFGHVHSLPRRHARQRPHGKK